MIFKRNNDRERNANKQVPPILYIWIFLISFQVACRSEPLTPDVKDVIGEEVAQIATPTFTAIPPTYTETPTPVPTSTQVPTSTATNTPTATDTTTPTPAPTATPTNIPTPLPPTPIPTISDTDRVTYGLLLICERIFFVTGENAIIPNISECFEELSILEMPGADFPDMVFAPGGHIAVLSIGDKVINGAVINLSFVSYLLENNIIDKNSGTNIDNIQLGAYYDESSPSEWIIIINSEGAGEWSGYIDLTKAPFELNTSINEQQQPPLQAGNQFE